MQPVVFGPSLDELGKCIVGTNGWVYRPQSFQCATGLLLEAPKWMVGLGWLERSARGTYSPLPDDPIQRFFLSQLLDLFDSVLITGLQIDNDLAGPTLPHNGQPHGFANAEIV